MNDRGTTGAKSRVPYVAIALIAASQVVLQATLLAQGEFFRIGVLANDDTFYYLQCAYNLKRFGFVTFDGVHPTNGLQLLWFWITAGLAWLAPGKGTLLIAAQGLCLVMNAACHGAIAWLGHTLGRPHLAVVASLAWAFITLEYYLSAMENSLHALLFWLALAVLLASVRRNEETARTRPAWLAVILLLVALVWVRLDQALAAVVLGGLFALLVGRRFGNTRAVRRAAISALLIAAAGAGMLLMGYRMLDSTWLPVSVLIKSGHYGWDPLVWADLLYRGFTQALPPVLGFTYFRVPHMPLAVWGAAVLTAAVAGAALAGHGYRRALGPRGTLLLLAAILLLPLFQAALYAGLGELAVYARWYFSPLFIALALLLAIAVDGAAWYAGRRSPRLRTVALSGVFALLLMCVAVKFHWVRAAASGADRSRRAAASRVAAWLDANTPTDSRCAAWNAGTLGYYANRPLTNLDGLVNSAEFAQSVLQKRLSMVEYLRRENVSYVVDYSIPADVCGASDVVHTVPIPDDRERRSFEIRELRSR